MELTMFFSGWFNFLQLFLKEDDCKVWGRLVGIERKLEYLI